MPFKKLNSNCIYEPLHYIEAKLVTTMLNNKNHVYGSPLECDINLNNFYKLIMIDAVQLLSQQIVMKVL